MLSDMLFLNIKKSAEVSCYFPPPFFTPLLLIFNRFMLFFLNDLPENLKILLNVLLEQKQQIRYKCLEKKLNKLKMVEKET